MLNFLRGVAPIMKNFLRLLRREGPAKISGARLDLPPSASSFGTPRRYPILVRKLVSNPLTGLWLNPAPSAYSFCNLDTDPITAYSHFIQRNFWVFGPPRASKQLKPSMFTGVCMGFTNKAQGIVKR